MTSAFWGGFAGSLKDRLDDDRRAERDLEKEDKLLQLKKKYEQEIIDSSLTQIVGNEEIRYNKYGTEISRRTLNPEELAIRKAAMDKSTADARRAVTEADMSEYDYGNREEDRTYKLEDRNLEREATRARIDQGWGALDLQRERNDLDKDGRKSDREYYQAQKAFGEVLTALEQAPDALAADGVSSLSAGDAAIAEIEGLMNAGEYAKANAAIARLKGKLRNSVIKAESSARNSLDLSSFNTQTLPNVK